MESRGKKSMFMAALAYLYESPVLDDSQKERIKNSKAITNLERLLSDPYVRESSGMIYKERTFYLEQENPQKLQVFNRIINDVIADEPIKVDKIYNKEKRAMYIDEIIASLTPSKGLSFPITPDKSLSSSPTTPDTSLKSKKEDKRRKVVSHKRNTIIPRGYNLHITQPRLIKIYTELKSLDVKKISQCRYDITSRFSGVERGLLLSIGKHHFES